MDFDNLNVNQQIELKIKRGPYHGTYPSKIEDITENQIKVMPPYVKGELLPLRQGLKLKVYFTGNNATFGFHSRVISRIKDPIPLLIILPPKEIVRIQRRDYFRLNVRESVKYRRINKDEESLEDLKETVTSDLSGGGVRIILEEEELNPGTLVEVFIDLPEIEDVPIIGKVVQLYDLPEGEAAGINFIDLHSRTRDQIIGWLFEYQRKLRRKGLL